MSEACSRWMALSDRQALGDTLSAQEQSFLGAHATNCPACGAEGAFFRDLSLLVDGSPAIGPGTAARALSVGQARAARRRRLGWALAAVAASLVLAIAVQKRGHPVAPPTAGSALSAPAIRIALASGGEIEVDGRPAQLGADIALGSLLFARSGAVCLLVDQGIRACLAPGGLLRVAELSGTSRRLELRAGKLAVSLEPQRAGSSFGIVTREGSAIAVGTAFSVEVPPDGGPVVTRVVHGTVLVRSARGAEQHVHAHQASTMQDSAAQPLSARDEAGERPLLELAERAPRTRPGSLRIESQPAGAQVLIDGRPVGVTPLGLLLESGEHTLVVNGPRGRTWREQVHVAKGAPLVRSFADPATAARAAAPALATHGQAQAREASGDEHTATTQLSAQRARGEPPDTGRSTAARRSTAHPLRAHTRTANGDAPSRLRSAARERRAHREIPDGNGDSASGLLSAAREQRARGDLEGALDSYRALFTRHEESNEALAARVAYGEMLLASDRDPGGALASFEHYLARGGPLAREASFGRVRALRALDKLAEERAALEDFLRSFPDGPLADAVRARQRALERP